MGVLEILGLVLGSGGISSLATWLFHIKAERRLKMAEAEKRDRSAVDGKSISPHSANCRPRQRINRQKS